MRRSTSDTDPFTVAACRVDMETFNAVVRRETPSLETEEESEIPEIEDASGCSEKKPAFAGFVDAEASWCAVVRRIL